MGQHGSASGSILLGLDGFEVTAAEVVNGEWQLEVQTTATVVGCGLRCGPRPMAAVRSGCGTPLGGRPVVLCWRKRGSGAVGSRPARCVPGPSGRRRSVRGRC